MSDIETVSSEGYDPERFQTAFYRFLETCPPPSDEAAWLRPTGGGLERNPVATLWSREAGDNFRSYLAVHGNRIRPRVRYSRFDDAGY